MSRANITHAPNTGSLPFTSIINESPFEIIYNQETDRTIVMALG